MRETLVPSLDWGRSPGEGNGNPLQFSCPGNPTDREAWWAAVHGAAKSQTGLSTAQQSKGEELVSSCRKESRQGGKELVMKGCVRGELCQGHFPLIESVFGKYSPLCIMKDWRNWLILRDHELMHMHANPACTSLCYVSFPFVFSGCACI